VKRYRVQSTAHARAQMQIVSRWWRENRPSNPALFRDELTAATARLSAFPGAGTSYEESDVDGVRRVLLPRTSYHVYYVVNDATRTVTIMAVWHSARGQGPPLR
jgi:plasmid stabilization system protein ParE